MALIKCSECDSNVSTEAVACPNCGMPVSKPQAEMTRWDWIKMWLMLAALATAGVWFIRYQLNNAETPSPPPAQEKPRTQAEKDKDAGMALVYITVQTVKKNLKDSDSAKFRNVFAVKSPAGKYLACGEVNARNALGGYAGYEPFVASDAGLQMENPSSPNSVRKRWNASCAKFPMVYQSHRND